MMRNWIQNSAAIVGDGLATHRRQRVPAIAIAAVAISFATIPPCQVQAADSPAPMPADEAARDLDPKALEFFETKIRPVLVQHCYECHAADATEVKGSLLVDSSAGLLQGGDSGPSLVPGKPTESLLLDALKYDGLEMPPAGRLPDSVVRDFERWIEMGAPDPRIGDPAPKRAATASIDIEAGRLFWAFQPVGNPSPPEVKDATWPASDLDAFVLAKLEEHGLKPAPEADRRTLIRRVYFDLIGLPPSPEDVAAFLNDDRADAFERVVDRLLESPQYGVHWGRHWLDVARYADSNGNDFNATFHDAWRYRDYVINAFNNDKPFDRFVREQVAGDLLPAESDAQRSEQLIATGFLMAGTTMLSERDKEKLRMDVVDEQINTLGQAFLGLTLGCARCHDHKFDPVPTRDYYALAGIFRSTTKLEGESQQYVSTWPKRPLPADPEHVAQVDAHNADVKKLAAEIKAAEKARDRIQQAIDGLKNTSLVVDDAEAKLVGDWKPSTFSKGFIGVGYIHDDQSGKGEKSVEFTIPIPADGEFDVQLTYAPAGNRADDVPVRIQHADGEFNATLNQQQRPTIDGIWASVGKLRFNADTPAVVTISNEGTTGYVVVDAVRLVPTKPVTDPADVSKSKEASTPVSKEAADERQKLDDELKAAVEQIEQLQTQFEKLKASAPPPLPTAFAVADHAEIGDCALRIRGEHKNLGDSIPRGFVQVAMTSAAPEFPTKESGRRELADWLVDPANPLTARVYVNRIWCGLLGEGLVRSVDNFGRLGDQPTHPELLDRLASDFIASGWSTRTLVRQIVTSRVYRMNSQHDDDAWQADPENRLLWRAHRRRIPAESIRDGMLSISGQLDLSPGGSPVEGFGVLVTQNVADEKQIERAESLRRSAYLPIIRSGLPRMLVAFDFADPDLVTGQRSVTNVPAQALMLLNSPFVLAQSRHAARRMVDEWLADGGAPSETAARDWLIQRAYERTLTRLPDDAELQRAREFLIAAATTEAGTDTSNDETAASEAAINRLASLIHMLFASTEFRMVE